MIPNQVFKDKKDQFWYAKGGKYSENYLHFLIANKCTQIQDMIKSLEVFKSVMIKHNCEDIWDQWLMENSSNGCIPLSFAFKKKCAYHPMIFHLLVPRRCSFKIKDTSWG